MESLVLEHRGGESRDVATDPPVIVLQQRDLSVVVLTFPSAPQGPHGPTGGGQDLRDIGGRRVERREGSSTRVSSVRVRVTGEEGRRPRRRTHHRLVRPYTPVPGLRGSDTVF